MQRTERRDDQQAQEEPRLAERTARHERRPEERRQDCADGEPAENQRTPPGEAAQEIAHGVAWRIRARAVGRNARSAISSARERLRRWSRCFASLRMTFRSLAGGF